MSTAGFHITEDCAEVYLQNESSIEFLQLAGRLHDYLRQGQHLPVRSLFEATDDCKRDQPRGFRYTGEAPNGEHRRNQRSV